MRKKGLKNKRKPYILVFLQFSTLFGIMFTGPLFASGFVLLGVQVCGVFLGLWSVYIMKIGNFKIIPIPVEKAVLRMEGPYKLIRHPMYISIILFALPELLNYFTYCRLWIFIFLVISLLVKLKYEEEKLLEKFPEYLAYMQKSKRLIPFLY